MLGATTATVMNKSTESSLKNLHYYEKIKAMSSVRQQCQQAEDAVLPECSTAVILHQYITPQPKLTPVKVKAAPNSISSFMNFHKYSHPEHLSQSARDHLPICLKDHKQEACLMKPSIFKALEVFC